MRVCKNVATNVESQESKHDSPQKKNGELEMESLYFFTDNIV